MSSDYAPVSFTHLCLSPSQLEFLALPVMQKLLFIVRYKSNRDWAASLDAGGRGASADRWDPPRTERLPRCHAADPRRSYTFSFRL